MTCRYFGGGADFAPLTRMKAPRRRVDADCRDSDHVRFLDAHQHAVGMATEDHLSALVEWTFLRQDRATGCESDLKNVLPGGALRQA